MAESAQVERVLSKLRELLPLEERQQSLEPILRRTHRTILRSFFERGRPPLPFEVEDLLQDGNAAGALAKLAEVDLVVLDADGSRIVGAYPFTREDTPHTVSVGEHTVYAMCAIDALSVAPMFDAEATVDSRCHGTGSPVRVHQRGWTILGAEPSRQLHAGIHWRKTGCCAADSLCTEMIFLRDPATAQQWRSADPENRSIFTLEQAVELGAGFFCPLIREPVAAA